MVKSAARDAKHLTNRGRQTGARLKDAARAALGERGADGVKIADVTSRAGVAVGLLYRYFPDLPALFGEVVGDWVDAVFAEDGVPPDADPFTALKATILGVVERIDREPGLFMAVQEASGRFPEASRAWRTGLERWLRRRMQPLNEAFPGNAFGVEHLVAGLGGALEGFLIARYVRNAELALDAAGSPEEIAELLALIWHRAIRLENPPDELLERYAYIAKIRAA
jgi:AcrR family transcriptional regulator